MSVKHPPNHLDKPPRVTMLLGMTIMGPLQWEVPKNGRLNHKFPYETWAYWMMLGPPFLGKSPCWFLRYMFSLNESPRFIIFHEPSMKKPGSNSPISLNASTTALSQEIISVMASQALAFRRCLGVSWTVQLLLEYPWNVSCFPWNLLDMLFSLGYPCFLGNSTNFVFVHGLFSTYHLLIFQSWMFRFQILYICS